MSFQKVAPSLPCIHILIRTLFWSRKTSVIIKKFQSSFHVFVCISFGDLFIFRYEFFLSFPIFCVIRTLVLSIPRGLILFIILLYNSNFQGIKFYPINQIFWNTVNIVILLTWIRAWCILYRTNPNCFILLILCIISNNNNNNLRELLWLNSYRKDCFENIITKLLLTINPTHLILHPAASLHSPKIKMPSVWHELRWKLSVLNMLQICKLQDVFWRWYNRWDHYLCLCLKENTSTMTVVFRPTFFWEDEIFRISFRVFVCAFPLEISSNLGKRFSMSFPLFCVIRTSVLSFPHGIIKIK